MHPGQAKLDRVVDRVRFTVVMCGRRFGKSTYGGRRCAKRAVEGCEVGWFAPNYKYAGPIWRWLVQKLRPAAKKISEQDKRIELHGGGLVEVWTLDNPDAGRSRRYHELFVDEAGLVRDLEMSWNESLRPTLTDYRGKAVFLGTPKGMSHDFVAMFNRAEAGRKGWAAVRAKSSDNPFIPKEELEEAKADMPEVVYRQEYEGIPAPDGGNPFGYDAIKDAFVVTDESWMNPVVFGWDVARAVDFTVGLGLDARMRAVKIERWQKVPWGETERRMHQITGRLPAWVDSTGVGDSVVDGLQRQGMAAVPYVFSVPSKQKLMVRLAGALQRRQLKLPITQPWLRAELESFAYEYKAGGVRYVSSAEHDDGVMALALALYGWDQISPSEAVKATGVIPIDTHPGFDRFGKRKVRWDFGQEEETPKHFTYTNGRLTKVDV